MRTRRILPVLVLLLAALSTAEVARAAPVRPDDPRFATQQWGLENTGQKVEGLAGTADADIDAPEGWSISHSSAGTVTAVISTGIDPTHPDLAGRVWRNPGEIAANDRDDDGNGYVDDVGGWDFLTGDAFPDEVQPGGTHMAGVIGATGNNGLGISGVSWDATIMPLRACTSSSYCPPEKEREAIAYAVDNGADVVTLSNHYAPVERLDLLREADDTLFVVPAGGQAQNNDERADGPCEDDAVDGHPALQNLVCVGATAPDDTHPWFSNWGPTSVDLLAPGMNIVSTSPIEGRPRSSTPSRASAGGTTSTSGARRPSRPGSAPPRSRTRGGSPSRTARASRTTARRRPR